jgi:hypothetical protein
MTPTIADLADQPLKWHQPSLHKLAFELRADGECIATLTFRSAGGTLATARSGEGCWTFKRVGFWQNRATVRVCESAADLAVFQNDTWKGGGTLEFSAGGRFRATTSGWTTNYELQSETGETLVRFKFGGAFRLTAGVEIQPAARKLKQLPVLVLFGWYLAVMLSMDSGAAAAVTTAG